MTDVTRELKINQDTVYGSPIIICPFNTMLLNCKFQATKLEEQWGSDIIYDWNAERWLFWVKPVV